MRTVVRGIALAYLMYLALSFLVLLPVLNFVTPWLVHQQIQRTFSSELILFNPFSLTLHIREAELGDADGSRLLAFDRAQLNLSLATLWQPGLVFDVLALEGLYLHLLRRPDGQFNIADLAPAREPAAAPDPEADQDPLGITVGKLRFSAHRIEFIDQQHPQDYQSYLEGLRLEASGLSTVIEAGQAYHLVASSEGGGELEWRGDVSIAAGHSTGELALRNIDLRPLWRFAEPWLAFELERSTLELEAHYHIDWSGALRYGIDQGRLELRDSVISAADTTGLPDTGVSLASLQIEGIAVASAGRTVTVDHVLASELEVAGWSEGSRVSLAELFAMPATDTRADDSDTPPWQARIDGIELQDSQLRWRSEYTDPALLTISPVDAELRDLHWPAQAESPLTLSLRVNDQASLGATGKLHLGSGDGSVEFELQALPLAWLGPNLPPVLRAEIGSGLADTAGTLTLRDFAPDRIELDGAITDFSMVLHGADDALTRWDHLSWHGLALQLAQRRLELAELHLEGYEGRLHILKDGSINVQRLLEEDAAGREHPASEPASAAVDAAPQEPAWHIAAPAIFVSDSQLDFEDESLPIRFRSVIGGLNGTITDLGTDPGQPMKIDLQGSVDGYAPVTLDGTARPLQEPPALDLELNFRGVDMARLTPYSATYAGYEIERGSLDLTLQYALKDNRLQGDNELLIKQLKLGERVESDRALDLPLRLGIALLTDSSGVIDVTVPVSGDINNPEFNLGSVITGALVNLFTKMVTAPFRLLAGLVGSDEDLETVDFAAGSTELDNHGQQKLRDLAEAMQQRPAIKLVLTGQIDPDTDRRSLQQQRLQQELLDEGWTGKISTNAVRPGRKP
ncbi:DUF748 domain-containing protein [Kineobactrum salinum]|uniref:DUF748 domain-containing protein n=1 Tax=Kineobactrum salinum TaxID=2708301 RepID=A0A6C0U3K6_9GAMM|nr:DUF748 domain-containing protein [Kineobactrum salinum]QIB66750.1 DUF748 domain-containing protein [Kineobactrum salinum]